MRIRHYITTSGHFVEIQHGRRTMNVLTEHGTSDELRKFAGDEEARARSILRRAKLVRRAADRVENRVAVAPQ